MARLIDELRRAKHGIHPTIGANIPVFVADEIWKGIDDSPDKVWEATDFPNIAPPFDYFFIEARTRGVAPELMAGLLFVDLEKHPEALPEGLSLPPIENFPEEVHWRMGFTACRLYKRQITWLPLICILHIGKDGAWLDDPNQITTSVDLSLVPDKQTETYWLKEIGQYIPFALMTLSILHCKNVEVVDNEPPEKLSRRAFKEHGVPLHRTKTLTVRPTRKQHVEAREFGVRRGLSAQHIVRGHFRTYTDEAPLYGKWVGTYWVESHLRGKAERGKVDKTYKVKPDEQR